MYHRFEENKYPSTNIKMNDFIEHLKILDKNNIHYVHPKNERNLLAKGTRQCAVRQASVDFRSLSK